MMSDKNYIQSMYDDYFRNLINYGTVTPTYWVENPMKKQKGRRMKIYFKYQNGSEYIAKDVVEWDLEKQQNYYGLDFSGEPVIIDIGWDFLTYITKPDKHTTIDKVVPADDLVGFIVKESDKTTIYTNPRYKTVVDSGVETMRQRIRRHNRKVNNVAPVAKEQWEESFRDQSDINDWRNIKSFVE